MESDNICECAKFAVNFMGHAWACPEFKQMEIQNRWESAKRHKLCFHSLDDGHLGQFCNRTRV